MSYRALLAAREARARSSWKDPVDVVAITSVTPSGTQTIDGVALAANDYVLRVADGVQNGIWQVKAGPWVRREDADTGWKLPPGTRVPVGRGTYANKVYKLTNATLATVGVDTLTFINELTGVESFVNVSIDDTDSPYSASVGELVKCDCTNGPVTVSLPEITPLISGQVVVVQKRDASGNNARVQRSGTDTVNTGTLHSLTSQYERATAIADNDTSDWSI